MSSVLLYLRQDWEGRGDASFELCMYSTQITSRHDVTRHCAIPFFQFLCEDLSEVIVEFFNRMPCWHGVIHVKRLIDISM
jgi:hypothetical protein